MFKKPENGTAYRHLVFRILLFVNLTKAVAAVHAYATHLSCARLYLAAFALLLGEAE
ncbi:MAG: hypothetical protein JWN71_1755 [Xanthobacteraceae bacterium]|jgi:hypothetical protein|nr:hypothetical protein [Xanthobacteraceae bacterium]